jgi:mannose-1-phosphate guanylyltransferase
MVERTLDRLGELIPPQRRWIVTDSIGANQVRKLNLELPEEQVLVEPVARDTAPAIVWSALRVRSVDPKARTLVLPADHAISPPEAFQEAVRRADRYIDRTGGLLTFGILPDSPHTGYGYIQRESALEGSDAQGIFSVDRFIEKPSLEKAREYVEGGRCYWNSGMFLWRVEDLLSEFGRQWPETGKCLEGLAEAGASLEKQKRDYESLPKTSIDYGVMEKASSVVVLPVSFDWDDVGSWAALPRHRAADDCGNVVVGEHLGIDTEESVVFSEGDHLVATLGVRDLVIVRTADVTLVCSRDRAEEVKRLVEALREQGGEDRT